MEFNFSFVVREIFNAWSKRSQRQTIYQTDYDRNQINVINAIYRTVWNVAQHVPVGQRPEDDSVFIKRSTDASHIMKGLKAPHKKIIESRNCLGIEEKMPEQVKYEISKNLDQDKIDNLIEQLVTCVYYSNIKGHIREDIKNHASREYLDYLLMRVIRVSLDGCAAETDQALPKDPYLLIVQLEETCRKTEVLVREEDQQDALLIEMLNALGKSLKEPGLFTHHIKVLENRSTERAILLQEMRRQYEHVREMNTYTGGRSSKNTILCTPSCDVLLTSAEAAIAELEERLHDAIFGNDEDVFNILNNTNLPETKETADILFSLSYQYGLPEMYEILFDRYAHFLNPDQHKAAVEQVKFCFEPWVYEDWDMEYTCPASDILMGNGLINKDTTKPQ